MIQAQSLGHLLQLADEPPLQYPSEQSNRHGSLTLYIARVPGSKDFFCTTIKPLDKVVRAGDVESCLYYVHVSTEKDADLLREAEETLLAEDPNIFPPMTGVAGQKSAVRRKPVLPSRPSGQPDIVPGSYVPRKTQLNHDFGVTRKPVEQENAKKQGLLQSKRLMGPRPLNGHDVGLKIRDVNINMSHKDPPLSHEASTRGLVTSTPDYYSTKQLELDKLYESNTNIDNHFAGSRDSLDTLSPNSSMTLIRRYDGFQSNIGLIEANGIVKMESNGYRKFEQAAQATTNRTDACSFSTCVEKMGSAPLQFLTPWKTMCQFTASIGGRTLRCTHMAFEASQSLPVMSELRFNLPSSQALRSTPKRPLSDIGTSSKRSSFMRLHQRGKSDVVINSEGHCGAKENGVEKMDLSLGQELAGGGFGGKNAKIAKLIIHPEGFPMLDLLVAANLSVFSRIYEKYGSD